MTMLDLFIDTIVPLLLSAAVFIFSMLTWDEVQHVRKGMRKW